MMLLGPSLIQPLFNEYAPVPEGEVKQAIERLAVEANIPTDRIFMYDGSRQSNNFTANVSGIGSSARIAISDIALKEANLDEVKAVTGHEIGHYVSGTHLVGRVSSEQRGCHRFFACRQTFQTGCACFWG
jgi:STE24 endopeptidase